MNSYSAKDRFYTGHQSFENSATDEGKFSEINSSDKNRTDIDPSRELTSLKVTDLLHILRPIHSKIDKIDTDVTERLNNLESRVGKVEATNNILQHLALLTEGIATMQQSIDKMVSRKEDDKEVSIVISDLSEGTIDLGEGVVMTEDREKFIHLVRSIGVEGVSEETINGFRYERIGESDSSQTPRALQVTVDKGRGKAAALILWHLWNLFR